MGRITEDLTFRTTFDFKRDRENLCVRALGASTMATRRYLFVGETHNSVIDKQRTHDVVVRCAEDDDIIIVAERDILKDWPHLECRNGLIHEKDRKSSSGSPLRNSRIVEQILEETVKDTYTRRYGTPRMVLILFGQEHEVHIRRELESQTGPEERICWWSFPTTADDLHALQYMTYPNQMGYTCHGFVKVGDDPEARKELLAKGRYFDSFTIDVLARFNGPSRVNPGQYYALYVQNTFGPVALLVRDLDRTGKARFNCFTSTCARLVRMDDTMYQTLKI